MNLEIYYSKNAVKQIDSLHAYSKKILRHHIQLIANGRIGLKFFKEDTKHLPENIYIINLGKLRIMAKVEKEKIIILNIQQEIIVPHLKQIYP